MKITAAQKEAIAYVLDLAYGDQSSYLHLGNPELDYGVEWPETAREKARMFKRIAQFALDIGLGGETPRWKQLAEQFRDSAEVYEEDHQ